MKPVVTASSPAVDARNVTKSFDGRVVVNRVSIQVRRGEIFGFLGPNGSGKTTFIRILCGLLRPDHAEGTCLGFDLLHRRDEIKRRIGYMTQKYSLYEDLTVEENLQLMARLYRLDRRRERVDAMIERMNFGDRRRQLSGAMSGGWKQRLALASCLLHDPELLLLDEPTAGVDPAARRDFWDELHNLTASGITALVSTHYMDEAERCHRLAYLAYGNLLTQGTLHEVVAASGLSTWTVQGGNLSAFAVELRGLPGIEQVVPFGESVHVTGSDRAALTAAVQPFFSRPGLEWRETAANLEDVFIYLSQQRARDNFQ
ncbi:MAG: ABC transporter ATP-binding protein [Victivallales bacterium]|nr:ABC transporter ATP-binding protein [Victivallales bacterium]